MENSAHMFLDGARTDLKDHANFAVSFALNHPREHFRLAFAQTESFGTGIEWVVECHNLFVQLCGIATCAGRTLLHLLDSWLHLCLFGNPLLFCAIAAAVRVLGKVYYHAYRCRKRIDAN